VSKYPSVVAVVCWAVAAGASAPAAEQGVAPRLKASPRPGAVITGSTKPQDSIRPVQRFAGRTLTEERAKGMADAAGFKLLDFFPCAYSTDRCAMFQVRGKRGNVFLYQVSSERCMTAGSPQTNPNGAGDLAQPGRRRRAQGGLSPTSTSAAGGAGAEEETGGEANYCFAGYRADYRTREANTVYADNTGYSMKVDHHYQLIQDGRWKDVVTATTSSWSLLKEAGRGTTNRGWAYEMKDSAGTVLTSDSGSVDVIASEGGNGVELTDRCQSKHDLMLKTHTAVNEGFFLACKVATLAIPDSTTGTISFEPLGVGVSIEASKNLDLCTNGRDTTAALIDAAAQWLYDDCINHPGKYFPADYPADPGAYDLKVLPGFKSPYAVLLEGGKAPQNCPSSYVSLETVDMGGGTTCQANVRYTCETTVGGACECKDPKVEGQIACVTVSGGR
jgi:hypothetical protein